MSLDDQMRAVLEGAGLLRRPGRTVVRVRGSDRSSYLNRMLSQDLAGLTAGRAVLSTVLDAKARVLGDPLVWNLGDEILLDLDDGAAAGAIPALERYVLADDVVFAKERDGFARLTLLGPSAPEVAEAFGVPVQSSGQHDVLTVAGAPCRVLRFDRCGAPQYEWILPADAEPAVRRFLLESLPAVEVGADAYDLWRVAHGVPAWGRELGPDVMPLEARLDGVAVSFTKGCYPGQEPVAKAHHRGHPPNLLVRLALEGVAGTAEGRTLSEDGHAVGRLTTVAVAVTVVALDGAAALGYVRHGMATGGRVLAVEGGGSARVLDR